MFISWCPKLKIPSSKKIFKLLLVKKMYTIIFASGAFDAVQEAKRESDAAQAKVDDTADIVRRSEALRDQTENLLKDKYVKI